MEIYIVMKKNESDIHVEQKKKKKKASSRYDIIECNLGQIWKNAK